MSGVAAESPELVTSLAAERPRAYDLAVGNLFGRNALNMTFYVLLDPLHQGAPVLSAVSQVHALSALVGVVLISNQLPPQRRPCRPSFTPLPSTTTAR